MRPQTVHFPVGKVPIFSILYIHISNKHFIVYHSVKKDTYTGSMFVSTASFKKDEDYFNLVHG